MTLKASLCQTWWESQIVGFLMHRLILCIFSRKKNINKKERFAYLHTLFYFGALAETQLFFVRPRVTFFFSIEGILFFFSLKYLLRNNKFNLRMFAANEKVFKFFFLTTLF